VNIASESTGLHVRACVRVCGCWMDSVQGGRTKSTGENEG